MSCVSKKGMASKLPEPFYIPPSDDEDYDYDPESFQYPEVPTRAKKVLDFNQDENSAELPVVLTDLSFPGSSSVQSTATSFNSAVSSCPTTPSSQSTETSQELPSPPSESSLEDSALTQSSEKSLLDSPSAQSSVVDDSPLGSSSVHYSPASLLGSSPPASPLGSSPPASPLGSSPPASPLGSSPPASPLGSSPPGSPGPPVNADDESDDEFGIPYEKLNYRPMVNYERDVEEEQDFEIGWEWNERDPGPDLSPCDDYRSCLLDKEKDAPEDFFMALFNRQMFTIMAENTNMYARRRAEQLQDGK